MHLSAPPITPQWGAMYKWYQTGKQQQMPTNSISFSQLWQKKSALLFKFKPNSAKKLKDEFHRKYYYRDFADLLFQWYNFYLR